MAVPTYAVIADNELDPESPITASLMERLRDNPLAVLNIDPADPAPVFTIPPSVEAVELSTQLSASGSGDGTITTNEAVISVVSDDVEWVELANPVVVLAHASDVAGYYAMQPHIVLSSTTPALNADWAQFLLIETIYSAGTPTGVRIRIHKAVDGFGDYTITLANTWQSLGNMSVNNKSLQAKARATSTEVYLSVRMAMDMVHEYGIIQIPFNRRSFKSKAAT